ncbi:MAG: FkbM family methyltransferase [Deltaproteobacteria bacterium]|nr:FkbM family methyltransferase [Deltaproteobacteria bacterium]
MSGALKELVRQILPRRIRAHRILSGPLQGEQIITSWHDYPGAIRGTTEKPLLDWFSENASKGETWLDVGGHYGYTALALSGLVGETGRVFSFEPMLSTAGYLYQTGRVNNLSNLIVLPFALGASGALRCSKMQSTRGMIDSGLDGGGFEETFLEVSFDTLWPTVCSGNDAIDGVKIDVQGMEVEVLKGMRDWLKRKHPKLALEFHTGVDRAEIVELLENCGYRLPGIPIGEEDVASQLEYHDDTSYAFYPIVESVG